MVFSVVVLWGSMYRVNYLKFFVISYCYFFNFKRNGQVQNTYVYISECVYLPKWWGPISLVGLGRDKNAFALSSWPTFEGPLTGRLDTAVVCVASRSSGRLATCANFLCYRHRSACLRQNSLLLININMYLHSSEFIHFPAITFWISCSYNIL